MKNPLANTFVHASIYTIGIVLNRAISFVMLPFYTRMLSPKDYGILELLDMTVDVVSIVAGMGVLQGVAKFYYAQDTVEERNALVSTIFIMSIAATIFACAMGILFSARISSVVFGSVEYSNLLRLSFVNLFLQSLMFIPMAYLRVQQNPKCFVVVNAVKLILQLSLNILFLVFYRWGIVGVLYSTMLSTTVVGVWLTFSTFSDVRIRSSREKARRLLRFGLPFVVSGLGAFILTFSDRYFLSYYHGLSDIGVYALGYKLGYLVSGFPAGPLMFVWSVQRFELLSTTEYERVFNQFLSSFTITTVTAMLALAIFVGNIIKLMASPGFWPAAEIVPIILMASFFHGFIEFFNFGIYHSGKTEHMAYGTILGVVVILSMSFFLIPEYGMHGAAWATLVAYGLRVVYVYWASQRLFRVSYEVLRPAVATIIAISLYVVYERCIRAFAVFDSPVASAFFGIVLLASFLILLCCLKIIRPQTMRLILESIRSPLKTFGQISSLYQQLGIRVVR